MVVFYWCQACRQLHHHQDVRWLERDGKRVAVCARTEFTLIPRHVSDEPDAMDAPRASPRCDLCLAEVSLQWRFCPDCGEQINGAASQTG